MDHPSRLLRKLNFEQQSYYYLMLLIASSKCIIVKLTVSLSLSILITLHDENARKRKFNVHGFSLYGMKREKNLTTFVTCHLSVQI